MLNPTSPLPLYQQLADELSEQIRAGSFAPGDRIPSEHKLAAQYELGRPTVRQATEVLVRRRVLERKRGSGTFVSQEIPEVDLFSLGGTLSSFRRSGIQLRTRWVKKLARRKVDAGGNNPFAGNEAISVSRLGTVDRQPVLLEQLYFDPDVFPDLADSSPGQSASLSRHIEDRYHTKPVAGRQTFQVAFTDEANSTHLAVPVGSPILLVQRTLDFPRAPGALFTELFCHTDNLVFAQEIGDLQYA